MEDKQEQVDKAAKNQSVEYELQEIIDEDSVGRLGGAKTQYSVRNMGHQWGIPGSWLCTLTESPWACWSTQSERSPTRVAHRVFGVRAPRRCPTARAAAPSRTRSVTRRDSSSRLALSRLAVSVSSRPVPRVFTLPSLIVAHVCATVHRRSLPRATFAYGVAQHIAPSFYGMFS